MDAAQVITVFLADDNLLVRKGVKALLDLESDIEVVGVAADYDELVAGCVATRPQVVVTDIRMPPSFQQEGIEAAKEVRKRAPGTGIVVLSQYDDPEYAVALLSEGAAGYGYLLKDRVSDDGRLARAIREVATGGSALDPEIVTKLVNPVRRDGLSPPEEELLGQIAQGRTAKAIAGTRGTTAATVNDEVEALFLTLAMKASTGDEGALRRLRMLHTAIVDREEQGETLSRLLPGGVADKLRREGRRIGETEKLTVTVLISDIRGYTTIAEHADPSALAGQLNLHRAEMNHAILAAEGTVMQFIGDAVMAVFGAPVYLAHHATRALQCAGDMHARQAVVNESWAALGLAPFGLGIGLSTGDVAAALLGSEERLEYTVVGDTVNLAQRLQQFGAAGETIVSEATARALGNRVALVPLDPALVKGRDTPVQPYRVGGSLP